MSTKFKDGFAYETMVGGNDLGDQHVAYAISQLKASDRRYHLRQVFDVCIQNPMVRATFEDAMRQTPLIGMGKHQLDLRRKLSHMRANLHDRALMVLLLNLSDPTPKGVEGAAERISDALVNPKENAVQSDDTTTGYLFGVNHLYRDMDGLMNLLRANAGGKAAALRKHKAEKRAGSGDEDEAMEGEVEVKSTRKDGAMRTLKKPDGSHSKALDILLSHAELPDSASLVRAWNEAALLSDKVAGLENKLRDTGKKMEELRKQASMAEKMAHVPIEASVDGALPNGKMVLRKASEVFGITKGASMFEFDVPTLEWDGPHPMVPEVDKDYIFRPFELYALLYAVVMDRRPWLSGHTGTGKTTLIEQVMSRMNYPVWRVNLDSDISRFDFMGQTQLVVDPETGQQVSQFVEGILPRAMQMPCVLLLDELDYMHGDVAYAVQRPIEAKGKLLLTEDSGRLVTPHPMFRIMATGNTRGQGDETGLYPGAKVQSMAFLDRFTAWIDVDYMGEEDRLALLERKVPGLSAKMRGQVSRYVTEHIQAFTTARVQQPISPRGFIELAAALETNLTLFPAAMKARAVSEALKMVVLNKANSMDRAVFEGIMTRVFDVKAEQLK